MSIVKLTPIAAIFLGCSIVCTKIDPSFAQSTDRDNPTPLTEKILSNPGKQNGKTVYYYSLTAKPGKITITVDSDAGSDSGGFETRVRMETLEGKPIEVVNTASSAGVPRRDVKSAKFTSETPVLLLITSTGHHKIKIEGDWIQSGSASVPPAQGTLVPTPTKPELTSTFTSARNLSGVYKCNDGGTYYVRQNGNNLWWYGESGDKVGWTNIFKGTIRGNDIHGTWIDVPKGNNQGGGLMTLRASNGKFISTYKTGGFSGSEWTRQ